MAITTPIDLSRIEITDFAKRHFDPAFIGTSISGSPEDFMATITHPTFDKLVATFTDSTKPYVKTIVIENFTNCLAGQALITDENRHLLQTTNEPRRAGEEPVERTFFQSSDVQPATAKYLHLIVYSAGQLAREGITVQPTTSHAIVSINGEMVGTPIPPTPSTIARNEAGIAAGGNGCTYTKTEKQQSLDYHSAYANVR